MSQIDKWEEKRKRKHGKKKDNPVKAANVPLTPAPELPDSITVGDLRVEGDLDLSFFDSLEPDQEFMITPTSPTDGQVYTVVIDPISGRTGVQATDAVEVAATTDGNAPGSSPTPEVVGGPRLFSVKWDAIANDDLVTYEVHVANTTERGGSAAWATSASTFVGETPGTLAIIKKHSDGNDFDYSDTYYFKLVAKDADGSASASSESAASQLDPNASNDILAGSITAEHLESVMDIATTMIAGTWGGAHVQTGFGAKDDGTGEPELDPSFVGIRMYDGSGDTDPVFRVDASDGTVQVKGRIYFGREFGSRLTRNDMIQVAEQTTATYQTPVLEQSVFGVDTDLSDYPLEWPATPTVGNLLIVIVNTFDAGGNATNTWDGGLYTSVKNNTWASGNARQAVYKRVATGTDDDNISFSKSVDNVIVGAYEFSGVTDTEDAANATAESTTGSGPAETGTSVGNQSQLGLIIGTMALYGRALFDFPGYPAGDPTFGLTNTPAQEGYTQKGSNEIDNNFYAPTEGAFEKDQLEVSTWMKVDDSDTTPGTDNNISGADAWRGTLVNFKAKATAVEAAETDTSRIYTQDVSGKSLFHTVDEAGLERALVMGKKGERWDMEVMQSSSFNWASTAAHSVQNGNVTVTGVKVGDICIFLDSSSGQRQFIWRAEPIATVADQITLRGFNASTGTIDPASDTYYFLVIHRS